MYSVHILMSFRKLVSCSACLHSFANLMLKFTSIYLKGAHAKRVNDYEKVTYLIRVQKQRKRERENEKKRNFAPFRRIWFECARVEAMCVRMWYRWQHRLTFHVYIISLIALKLFYAVALCSKRVYDHASLDVCCSSVASNNLIQ